MKTNNQMPDPANRSRQRTAAFTIAELVIAIGFIGLLVFSLYSGFSAGFAVIKVARENLRATQLLMQRMDTIRLYTWSQLTTNTIPTNFFERYDPLGNSGVTYAGRVNIGVPPSGSGLPDVYRPNMLQVTATVFWTNRFGASNLVVRSRAMQTFVARYGMQPYIYGPFSFVN